MIPMRYCPTVKTENLEVGDWKWLSNSGPKDGGESPRAGIVYRNPVGDLAFILDDSPSNEGLGGARWKIVGDETTGLTVTPSIMHARGKPNEWHGYIRDGHLVTLED